MDFRYPRYPLYQTASWKEYDANGIGVGKALVSGTTGVVNNIPGDWIDNDPNTPPGVALECAQDAYTEYCENWWSCESDACQTLVYVLITM